MTPTGSSCTSTTTKNTIEKMNTKKIERKLGMLIESERKRRRWKMVKQHFAFPFSVLEKCIHFNMYAMLACVRIILRCKICLFCNVREVIVTRVCVDLIICVLFFSRCCCMSQNCSPKWNRNFSIGYPIDTNAHWSWYKFNRSQLYHFLLTEIL